MPKKAYKPAAIRESWRPDSANAEQRANRQRTAWRWMITGLLVLSLSAFGYLLFSPLFHPTLRLYFLTAGSYEVLDIKPMPYFREDAVRFLSIDGSFRKEDAADEFSLMDSPEFVRKYLQRIVSSEFQQSDVALIQISAHPMLDVERPFLKCSNFNRGAVESGAISIEEILNLLDRMTVGVTLICLNLGPSDSLSTGDSVRDDFLFSLRDLMKSRKNPNQWVLVSNSPQEGSYASMELHSSVFSYAVTKALQGSADLNQDAVIDLDEFTRFIVHFTQSQVERESGGNTQQNPILLSTGANSDAQRSMISIASTPSQRSAFSLWAMLSSLWTSNASKEEAAGDSDEKAAEKVVAEKVQKEKNWLTQYLDRSSARIQELAMDEIDDNINILPYVLGVQVKKSIGIEEEVAESTYANINSRSAGKEAEIATSEGQGKGTAKEESPTPSEPSETFERSPKSMPDMSRLANPKSSNLQLLQLAWQFCEFFELPQEGSMRPVDMAPHAWNEFTSHFHGVEERLRLDSVVDAKTIRLQLTSELVGAYQFAMTGQAQVGSLAKRFSSQMPALALPNAAFPSVGLMECLAGYGGSPLPSAIASQVQQLDAAIGMDSAESMDKWNAQLPKELSTQYVEFFWSQQFASRPTTPWKITRRVIRLWRQYERAAYDPMTSNVHVQQSLMQSQRSLLEGTRIALDQIGADWIDRCLASLDKAELALAATTDKRNQLRNALQFRNQTLAELRSVLRWRKIAATQLGSIQLDEDLEKSLNVMKNLCELLLDREKCEPSEVVRNHDSLKASMKRIQGYWIEESTDLIAGKTKASLSANWVADSLLATPLIRSPLRNRLLTLPISTAERAATERSESEMELDSMLPNLSSSRMLTKSMQLQVRLESKAAGIAGMDSDTSALETFQIAGEVDRFYNSLTARISKAFDDLATSTLERDLNSQLRSLRVADQSLRLLPILDSHLFDGKPLESRLWQLEVLQCILAKQNVSQKSIQDALPQEVPFLNNASERLAFLASSLSHIPQSTLQKPSRLNIRGTSAISLMTEPQSSGEVVLQNVGKAINNAWVLVDYDPSVLELEGPTGILLHQVSTLPRKVDEVRRQAEQQLMLAIAAGADQQSGRKAIDEAQQRVEALRGELVYPIHPETSLIVPTTGLAAGQVITIPFKVRRVGPGPSQSKLVWKLVGDGEYVRHEVILQLPEAENLRLVVDGVVNNWAPTPEGVDLFLWPNRPTEYRLGLRNDSGKPRVLSVEMVALTSRREITLPEGFLTSTASKEIEDVLGPTKLIASIPEVALDSKSDTVWLELQPLILAGAAPPGSAAKEKAATPIPTDQGLVIVFTEKATNQKYWRRVATRVRHPRSYVEPTVRFDAVSERAEIRLKARQPDSVPDKGIEVVGRILEPLPRGTDMKLEGSIVAGETLTLYCQVPTVSARAITFEIDIDGFPRAFVIQIPCWRTNVDIPIVSDFQKIGFEEPAEGLNLGPKEQSQKVRLRIDAIPGAFETKRDYVEVGWDLDRDREFVNESTVKFAAERQVDVAIHSIAAGRISMTAKVDDISLELPPPSLKNQRVNLLARLFAGGEMVWSKPIEVIADSDPPTITGVEIAPGTICPQGIDLLIRVGVDDARLSGIASVELKIDSQGAGKFADSAAAPKACVRESDGSWTLSTPTAELKPGRATLIVRATDRVGNISEESKTVLTILSEQDWKAKLKSTTHDLSGRVSYSDDPLPNAKVTLEDEKGVVVNATKTDERGAFRFLGVQAGKYKVLAIGVMKNRPRKAEQPVEVGGPQAPPMRLRLIAK